MKLMYHYHISITYKQTMINNTKFNSKAHAFQQLTIFQNFNFPAVSLKTNFCFWCTFLNLWLKSKTYNYRFGLRFTLTPHFADCPHVYFYLTSVGGYQSSLTTPVSLNKCASFVICQTLWYLMVSTYISDNDISIILSMQMGW